MSIFTRRNYVWLASVCRDTRHQVVTTTTDPKVRETIDLTIGILADALKAESPGFNRQQFLDAIYKDPTIDQMHSEEYESTHPKL